MLRSFDMSSRNSNSRVTIITQIFLLQTNHCRGVSACISPRLGLEDTARVCIESKADIIIVQHQTQLKNVLAAQHRLPQLKVVILLQGEPSLTDKRQLQRSCRREILSWAALCDLGQVNKDIIIELCRQSLTVTEPV